ncbi:MAG: ATP-binding protein, partial [Thermotogota bacterium]|nr:ATP-binding protein [Thermotogota bacterium]
NLLSNALKFTEKGTIQVIVKREQVNATEQEKVVFSVKDTGVGIDEEKQKILFKKFSQADPTIARKFGGTGLGLAISKRLVEMMNGHIDFKSEAGKGSEFFFRVPVKRATDEEIQSCELEKNESDETEEIPEISLNILVAEDNQVNQSIIKEVLSGFGWNYQLVNNGKEAIEAAKDDDFDVILMDVMMPVMDGLEATELIKALPEKSKIPIIALTASVTEADLQKVFQVGMDAYIPKPIKIIELKNTILKLISPDRQREVRRKCIDMKEVKKHIDDMELYYQTIIPVFIEDLRNNLSTMEEAIQEGNYEEIAALSHAIKPGCHYAGAVVLAQRIEKIEMLAKMNQPIEKIQLIFEEYKAEAERVLKFLEERSYIHGTKKE